MRLIVFLLIFTLSACSATLARITFDFERDSFDERIRYEKGSEDILSVVSENLSAAMSKIEERQFKKFKDPNGIRVYIFDDPNRFSRFANSSPRARGSSITQELYISPRVRESPDSVERILLHELSHVHVRQYLGTWSYVKDIPQWFHEGLATANSGGGGADDVSPAEAKQAIVSGRSISPDDSGSLMNPRTASDFGLEPHMFYRQSELFVEFLFESDKAGFSAALNEILDGRSFRSVWETNYGRSIGNLWQEFVATLKR